MNKILYGVLLSFMFVFLSVNHLYATDWLTANQVTLSWEPVATLENGEPIPEGNVIKYEVFYVPENGDKSVGFILSGETLDTKYVITFGQEGNFVLGVRATRWINEQLRGKSKIVWTDDPAVMQDGKAHGVTFFHLPGNVHGLDVFQNE